MNEHTVAGKVRAAGLEQGWLSPGEEGRILVALSGGGDSMAMFTALLGLCGQRVSAAHLEHGFRGEESRADAEFVSRRCQALGVECIVRSVDVNASRRPGESSEMAGRRIRYAFFEELARERGYSFIATGHTADDSIETMLYNMFRGSGIRGLSGIAGRRGNIVRPIIRCRREELRAYLRDEGVRWCEDATNDTGKYKRNLIRNELLPWVRQNLNGSPERALLDLASECARVSGSCEDRAEAICRDLEVARPIVDGALAAWDIRRARKLGADDAADALRSIGRRLALPSLSRSRCCELCSLINRSGRWRFQWSGDVEVAALCGEIVWCRRSVIEKLPEFSRTCA